ncbi:MAG: sulfocyanin-like copper-binding protein [Actinomycetota bacterium]
MRRGRSLVPLAVALALAAAACGGGGKAGGGGTAGGAGSVTLSLKEFSITSDVSSLRAGAVTFVAKNAGAIDHYLAVLRTDLPPGGLPLAGDMVIENGSGVTALADVVVAVGKTETTTIDLGPGKYVLICNIPGHYQAGMRTALTVA